MLSKPGSWRLLATLPLIIILGILIFPLSISLERINSASQIRLNNSLPSIRKSSFLAVASPADNGEKSDTFQVIVTAYSSRPEETDDDPFITASGQMVRQGIVANNLLPFGTVIRLPQLFGDQDFVVQDRMHHLKSDYHIDIWFPSTEEAIHFGAKRTIAIVEQNI